MSLQVDINVGKNETESVVNAALEDIENGKIGSYQT
jgi:hypothetical protein